MTLPVVTFFPERRAEILLEFGTILVHWQIISSGSVPN
jgi:hypothetical protein